jgi:hypothetical protein
MNADKAAKVFGCTPEQAKEQMQRNLIQLQQMRAKASSGGKKVNGYTADELDHMIAKTRKGWGL